MASAFGRDPRGRGGGIRTIRRTLLPVVVVVVGLIGIIIISIRPQLRLLDNLHFDDNRRFISVVQINIDTIIYTIFVTSAKRRPDPIYALARSVIPPFNNIINIIIMIMYTRFLAVKHNGRRHYNSSIIYHFVSHGSSARAAYKHSGIRFSIYEAFLWLVVILFVRMRKCHTVLLL